MANTNPSRYSFSGSDPRQLADSNARAYDNAQPSSHHSFRQAYETWHEPYASTSTASHPDPSNVRRRLQLDESHSPRTYYDHNRASARRHHYQPFAPARSDIAMQQQPNRSLSLPSLTNVSAVSSGDSLPHTPGPHESTSSSTSRSTTPSRRSSCKRKKQFKYLLENPQPGHARHNSTKREVENSNHKIAVPIDAAGSKKESRKKVKKACLFCKRSHMPCEEARPCQRCIKRNIAHLCRDAEPASAVSSIDDNSATSETSLDAFQPSSSSPVKGNSSADNASKRLQRADGQGRSHEVDHQSYQELRGASTSEPGLKPMMPISVLLSPAGTDAKRAPDQRSHLDHRRNNDLQRHPALQNSNLLSSSSSSLEPVSDRPLTFSTEAHNDRTSLLPEMANRGEAAWAGRRSASKQSELQQMLEAGPDAWDLSDILGDVPTSLLAAPSMVGMPLGGRQLRPGTSDDARSSFRHSTADDPGRSSDNERVASSLLAGGAQEGLAPHPIHVEELASSTELDGTIRPYSYTYGYAKLARWMQARWTKETCQEVDRVLGVIRPRLLAISRALPEAELVGVEETFIRLVRHYQANVLDLLPIPMLVMRRTGEIYAANEHAARLMQLPKWLFDGGQISHFQTVAEADAVDLWKVCSVGPHGAKRVGALTLFLIAVCG